VATNDTIWNILMEKYSMPREKSQPAISLEDLGIVADEADDINVPPAEKVDLSRDGEIVVEFEDLPAVISSFDGELSADQIKLLEECIYQQSLRENHRLLTFSKLVLILSIAVALFSIAAASVDKSISSYTNAVGYLAIATALLSILSLTCFENAIYKTDKTLNDLSLLAKDKLDENLLAGYDYERIKQASLLDIKGWAHNLGYDQASGYSAEALYQQLIRTKAWQRVKKQRADQIQMRKKERSAQIIAQARINEEKAIAEQAKKLRIR
jgi:hypothetical protein